MISWQRTAMYTWLRLTPIFLVARKALSLNLLAHTCLMVFHACGKLLSAIPN
jgi:hypothetical protein